MLSRFIYLIKLLLNINLDQVRSVLRRLGFERARMCDLLSKGCNVMCILPTLILLVVNIALSITILVIVTDQGDTFEALAEFANSELNIDQIKKYVDLSHQPSKPSEFFVYPNLGEGCNNLWAGSGCFSGTAFLFSSEHCNNCCFHLVQPNSCTEYSRCICYANDQSDGNRQLAIDRYDEGMLNEAVHPRSAINITKTCTLLTRGARQFR
jgi:hypothetical protein